MYYKDPKIWLTVIVLSLGNAVALQVDASNMVADYFTHKGVRQLVYLSCERQFNNKDLAKHLIVTIGRVAVRSIEHDVHDLSKLLHQRNTLVGVLLDGSCNNTQVALDKASQETLFDATHIWMVLTEIEGRNGTMEYIDDKFTRLNLSVDADIMVAYTDGDCYKLTDVFNFGKIQGNNLEKNVIGTWSRDGGLNITLKGFKYYDRWDFHNLTFRAVTVILQRPEVFYPDMLSEMRYEPGVAAMTKVVGQLLQVLRHQHNFRFNYTIADRWIGSPKINSTLAVTNSLYWRQQDLSYTCMRIFPEWLDWVEPYNPPVTQLETKFFYLMPDRGVGEYENRLATPLSGDAWAGAGAAAALCVAALCACAAAERRPRAPVYALCSVAAAVCQQAYEDGVQMLGDTFSSQGRRLTLLVVGLSSMLVYNYYTSSVVSWLLSAAPPALRSLDALAASPLELVFQDIGYTRGWLDNPGFYYYSGYKNPKEDELRERKVTRAKRTVPLFQSAEGGIELIRTGAYAYHSEPYEAGRELSRRLGARERCRLAALQMMQPANTYIVGQRRGPYKQFFEWSLLRLRERGHAGRARALAGGGGRAPACGGGAPRALALGHAAPALALLALAALLALLVLAVELLAHRFRNNKRREVKSNIIF